MEFTGRITRVLPTQSGKSSNGNEWKRQEFVFEYFEKDSDRWSDKVVLSVLNDRIEQYDIHVGDDVKIGFGHTVTEWNGRIFNELRMYKFEKLKASEPATPTTPAGEVPTPPAEEAGEAGGKLPF